MLPFAISMHRLFQSLTNSQICEHLQSLGPFHHAENEAWNWDQVEYEIKTCAYCPHCISLVLFPKLSRPALAPAIMAFRRSWHRKPQLIMIRKLRADWNLPGKKVHIGTPCQPSKIGEIVDI